MLVQLSVRRFSISTCTSRRLSFMGSSKGKLSVLGELWAFMSTRKKWWLAPIIFMLLLLGLLLIFTLGSALAPFIYTLF